jgi:hypothetical protein
LKLTFHASFGLLVAAFALGIWATNDRIGMLKLQGEWRRSGVNLDEVLIPGSCLLFYVFAVAFVVRLCRAWFFDDLREGEELAGGQGARVWLSGGNLVCAIAITLFGAYGFGYSPFALGLITFLAIVARPLLAAGVAASPATTAAPSDPQRAAGEGERERVLRLLEEGKVDADGAADLLNALGAAGAAGASAAVSRPPMSSRQRLAMAGGALVLVGFLLPWFSINLGKEMSRMGGVLNAEIGNIMPEMPPANMQMPIPKIKTGTVRVSGADVGKGLGWIVLVGGLLSAGLAVLPQLVADAALRRNLAIGAVIVGGATLFYVFGSSMRHVSYGIVAVVAGYFCIGIGLAESLRRGA